MFPHKNDSQVHKENTYKLLTRALPLLVERMVLTAGTAMILNLEPGLKSPLKTDENTNKKYTVNKEKNRETLNHCNHFPKTLNNLQSKASVLIR